MHRARRLVGGGMADYTAAGPALLLRAVGNAAVLAAAPSASPPAHQGQILCKLLSSSIKQQPSTFCRQYHAGMPGINASSTHGASVGNGAVPCRSYSSAGAGDAAVSPVLSTEASRLLNNLIFRHDELAAVRDNPDAMTEMNHRQLTKMTQELATLAPVVSYFCLLKLYYG